MIRIAIIVGKMNSGGKKNLIMEYYRHIDREKIQFDFICDLDSEAIPDDEIEMLGGRVYRIAPYQKIVSNLNDMTRLFKENKYLVVHAYNSTMNLFPMIAAKRAGVPIRISESLSMAHKGELKTLIKLILKPMSKLGVTHFMSCGEDCGRWQFGDKLFNSGKVAVFKTVINTEFNAYNSELRDKTRKKFGWEGKIVIGHIGRFIPQKNPVFLMEIFAEICKREDKAVMCLIGDGELRKPMFIRAKELGVMDRIIYLGRREDIQQFYNAMDIFVLPSLYEGLPVVGLEAQCCGLPIFFSTEVTREASAWEDLGFFIGLDEPVSEWADKILNVVKKNQFIRKSRTRDVENEGFDSAYEALRMQKYYLQSISKCKKK